MSMNGNLPSTNTSANPWADYASESTSRGPIEGKLLRFTKHGDYKAGQDGEDLPEGTRLLVYMPGLKRGWVKWHEQKPVRHILGLVAEGYKAPPRSELGDMDETDWPVLNGRPIDPWQNTRYLPMLDESGEVYTFVTASNGGIQAIDSLVEQYSKRWRMKPDEIPIIEIHATSYDHKQYGETFKPQFKVTGWAPIPENFTELASAMEGEEEGEQAAFTLAPPKAQVEELSASTPKRGPGRPAVANKAMATPAPAAAKGGKRPVKF